MKLKRHEKIIELIEQYDIETQDELAELLRKEGFDVTQATVSVISESWHCPRYRERMVARNTRF